MAFSSSPRERSRRLILQCVGSSGPVTRLQVEELTGLSRSSVADLVGELVREGRVSEKPAPLGQERRGRRPAILLIAGKDGPVIGVDLGHDSVRVGLADSQGTILAEQFELTPIEDPHHVVSVIARMVVDLIDASALSTDDIAAIGVGVPGPIGLKSGVLPAHTVLPDWAEFDLARELHARLGVPVECDNDANNGARGEKRFGAGRTVRNFVYIKAAHGIGAGLVLNGQIYRGFVGYAGEIGHTHLAGQTSLCRCGNRGCLETAVSFTRVGEQLVEQGLPWPPPTEPVLRSRFLSHPVVNRVLSDAGRQIGEVVAVVCNTLHPQLFVIGGELALLGGVVVAGIEESMNRNALPALTATSRVTLTGLGDRVGLLGAVALALEPDKNRARNG